jgi:hypothetical protein
MDHFKLTTDSFDRKLKELERRAEELGGEKEVTMNELLPDSFINAHSEFQSFQAMVDASGIKDPEELTGKPFSEFISAHTKFNNWGEMLKKASVAYHKRKLGL